MNLIDLFKDSTGYEPIPEITLKFLGWVRKACRN